MSRRPNPAADKAAANQQVIKSLLKLPGNRFCADCKRNKLPRWASWNLGIFICIRCSGIHRGMGTHISRVKSVDLDTWTEEQLQSILRWGNSKANKYWEANLSPGHVPSEAKIENFVRTKYESKRWVLSSNIPDPSTLEDSDEENLPLRVVQQKLETRQQGSPPVPTTRTTEQPIDLIGEDALAESEPRKASERNSGSQPEEVVPRGAPPSSKSTRPADSLLGLDFFAPVATATTSRPSSVNSNPGISSASRPDLNRSILSLYASTPKTHLSGHVKSSSSLSMATTHAPFQQQSSAMGDFGDAFSGLSFTSNETRPHIKSSSSTRQSFSAQSNNAPFANLTAGLIKSGGTSDHSKKNSTSILRPQDKTQTLQTAPASNQPSAFQDLFDLGSPSAGPSLAGSTGSPTLPFGSASSNPSGQSSLRNPSLNDPWSAPVSDTSNGQSKGNWDASRSSFPNAWDVSTRPQAGSSNASQNNVDELGAFSAGPQTEPNKPSGGFDDDLFGNVWK